MGCSRGKFDDDLDAGTPCTHCQSGEFTYENQTACMRCSAGLADKDKDPSTACERCGTGEASGAGSISCLSCAPGRADHDSNPATACAQCRHVRPRACPWGLPVHDGTLCPLPYRSPSLCSVGKYAPKKSTCCAECRSGLLDDDNDPGTPYNLGLTFATGGLTH